MNIDLKSIESTGIPLGTEVVRWNFLLGYLALRESLVAFSEISATPFDRILFVALLMNPFEINETAFLVIFSSS